MKHPLLALAALALAAPSQAQDAPEPPTPASVVAAAPAADWRAIDPADLLVMTLAPDRDGAPRQVVIQLMPPPFSAGWVGNVRTLAKAHWWDGTTVYRVVDNWVAQWGDGEDDDAKAKPLPAGLRTVPESDYETADAEFTSAAFGTYFTLNPGATSPAVVGGKVILRELPPEQYATFYKGFPFAGYENPHHGITWPTHCYGSVGVARNLSPDTGTGAELYAVIGHAPRQLDRNIAVVGRVIEGIEHLATLPRGKGEAGVYDDAALRVPIVSVRLGDALPEAERPRFEYLGSDSESFIRYVQLRANRDDAFYKTPAGGVEVCNVQVPIRRVAAP
jgi:peptidylprolyl isomerase